MFTMKKHREAFSAVS